MGKKTVRQKRFHVVEDAKVKTDQVTQATPSRNKCNCPTGCLVGEIVPYAWTDLTHPDHKKIVNVHCQNPQCVETPAMHVQCYDKWEANLIKLVQLKNHNTAGNTGQKWNKGYVREQLWTSKVQNVLWSIDKGYDSANGVHCPSCRVNFPSCKIAWLTRNVHDEGAEYAKIVADNEKRVIAAEKAKEEKDVKTATAQSLKDQKKNNVQPNLANPKKPAKPDLKTNVNKSSSYVPPRNESNYVDPEAEKYYAKKEPSKIQFSFNGSTPSIEIKGADVDEFPALGSSSTSAALSNSPTRSPPAKENRKITMSQQFTDEQRNIILTKIVTLLRKQPHGSHAPWAALKTIFDEAAPQMNYVIQDAGGQLEWLHDACSDTLNVDLNALRVSLKQARPTMKIAKCPVPTKNCPKEADDDEFEKLHRALKERQSQETAKVRKSANLGAMLSSATKSKPMAMHGTIKLVNLSNAICAQLVVDVDGVPVMVDAKSAVVGYARADDIKVDDRVLVKAYYENNHVVSNYLELVEPQQKKPQVDQVKGKVLVYKPEKKMLSMKFEGEKMFTTLKIDDQNVKIVGENFTLGKEVLVEITKDESMLAKRYVIRAI